MRHYRIYCLNEKGRILRARDAECTNDMAALAEPEPEHYPVEIWEGSRMVAMLRSPTLDHPKPEFSTSNAGAPPGLYNRIGGIWPIPLWGLSSL